jgi:hypothetical protein
VTVVDFNAARRHIGAVSDADDAEMQDMLARAEAAVTQLVGPLQPVTVTSVVGGRAGAVNFPDSWDGRSLVLPQRPVISLTSVTGSSGIAVDPSLLLATDEGVVYYLDGFSRFNEIWYTVVYQAGRTTLPADLELAILELLRHLWETQRGAALRTGSPLAETLAPTLPGAAYTFPIRIDELLNPYIQVEL